MERLDCGSDRGKRVIESAGQRLRQPGRLQTFRLDHTERTVGIGRRLNPVR